MIKIKLSEGEKYILFQYFKTSNLILIRLKSQAILMKERNISNKDISKVLFKEESTISKWIRDFNRKRMASIFTGHQNNENASKLTKEQKKEIKEILKKPPSEYGIPKEFWSVPSLKKYIKAQFKIVYESKESYYFLLKFGNLSFKKPEKFNIKRDDEFIDKRIEEIRREVKECSDNKYIIFSSDESRIVWESEIRKAWIKKGEKTIIKFQKSDEYQNYIGFLNHETSKCHLFELNWQKQEEIIKALKKLTKIYGNKKICIVWDNAKFHKGKLIRKSLQKGELLEKVHLINFPPYAPDKNPVEHIWKEAKNQISNTQFEDFNKTKRIFKKFITTAKFDYKI